MDLLHKLRAIESRLAMFEDAAATPGLTVIEGVLGPCEVIVQGRPTLMFGSNNYLGLTKHPDVVDAARRALDDYGTGTTGSRTANGTFALHEALERDFAEWFGKRHAIIFSTGYQANLSLIGGLCGAGDVILIDSDSHASIYDATRQTPSQVIGFRHNSADSLRRKLERLPRGERNRLVVVEGLYSIRGDVAPLLDIANICSANGAYLLVDEAHSLGTYGARGLGCAEDQGVLDRVDFIVGTFSKSLAGIGGVCVSDHPELRALHFLARAYVFTASGSPSNVASVAAAVRVIRQHPELRERLWTNIRALRRGLRDVGYAIGESESPIVPILIGDEERTIALWQGLLTAGLYVNLIVPPGCPKDDCVLRASCSAAHTPDQIDRALEIFARARSRSAESLALQRGHTVARAF
ncbi:MAG: 8-amino-7-oxononanoate synthase [Acidobacteria bacterium]|nr:MAG: 8-amino-7-oxononanoate synthase [Acidobacteriota bacterium]PYQ89499.1 MAG: 8-amino-7-oxononanoate synthase [Acidobacteriota bacterium]PYR09824.1 MAG: 8-amino-7-oxononanoate synthase [Acidobacteriota bacterium]